MNTPTVHEAFTDCIRSLDRSRRRIDALIEAMNSSGKEYDAIEEIKCREALSDLNGATKKIRSVSL